MNYNKLNSITRKFLLGENASPSIHSYIQALGEALTKLNPKTKADSKRIEIAKSQLREIKRHTRRLEEHVTVLQEQVKVLEESKEK